MVAGCSSSSGFSRNRRQEVSKREDSILADCLKWLHYRQTLASLYYFWRTYTGAEIAIVEGREGRIYAYECKWNRPAGRAGRMPESFLAAYPGASFEVITRASYRGVAGHIVARVPSTGPDFNLLPKRLPVSEGE
jgi:hypothetical protein